MFSQAHLASPTNTYQSTTYTCSSAPLPQIAPLHLSLCRFVPLASKDTKGYTSIQTSNMLATGTQIFRE